MIVPTHDIVIVRRGLDYGRQGFDRWDMTREVLKAFGQPSSSATIVRQEPRQWRNVRPSPED